MHLNKPGKPDIGGVLPCGRAFYVEGKDSHKNNCKCEHCSAQRCERRLLEASGALYVHARSVEEALAQLGLDKHAELVG